MLTPHVWKCGRGTRLQGRCRSKWKNFAPDNQSNRFNKKNEIETEPKMIVHRLETIDLQTNLAVIFGPRKAAKW